MSPAAPLRTLAAATLCAFLASAQDPKPAPQAQPAPTQPAPKDPEYVTTRDFKSKVFIVRNRQPGQLRDILKPLASGFKGAMISDSDRDGLRTLSVRDFPENVAAIEEALARLDVASPSQKEVELHIHVLFASRQEGPNELLPDELKDVIPTLKGTLTYRSFTPVASFVQRVTDGSYNLGGRGEGQLASKAPKGGATSLDPLDIQWGINALRVDAPQEGPASLSLGRFELSCRDGRNVPLASIQTNLSLKDGEKVVVGTATVKDMGLIVVVSATILK
jgi:hypothetical protein